MINKVIIYNPLFRQHTLLLKIILLLYKCNFYDALFIPNNNNIAVYLKGPHEAYSLYEKIYNIEYKTWNIDIDVYQQIIHHLKLECGLNIFDIKPQSGIFKIFLVDQDYYMRASLHPNDYKLESLSLRIIRSDIINNIIIPKIYTGGLVLIGGRTCSGKTSLMYNILLSLKANHQTIITLEDPIELDIDGITQTDIKHVSFTDGINSALRQNPDWICIGEIRDHHSANAAIRAAMTGHNVITTIHVKDSQYISLLNRFEEMGCKYLTNVISQFIYCYRDNSDFKYITNEDIINQIHYDNNDNNLLN